MNPIEDALTKAFAEKVATQFNVLHTTVTTSRGDDQAKRAAQSRFKDGLDLAVETLRLAKEAAGIP